MSEIMGKQKQLYLGHLWSQKSLVWDPNRSSTISCDGRGDSSVKRLTGLSAGRVKQHNQEKKISHSGYVMTVMKNFPDKPFFKF